MYVMYVRKQDCELINIGAKNVAMVDNTCFNILLSC